MRLSIIIPTLNESLRIVQTLNSLQWIRSMGHEIIVVDGGSQDGTGCLVCGLVDVWAVSERGRATQMNKGAELASGELLLFLHADTILPKWTLLGLLTQECHDPYWGRFDVRLSGRHCLFRVIEKGINLRSRLSGIATGDQAIFVHRSLFDEVGRYPNQPLMEDIELSKRLRLLARPLCLRQVVITSSRRWAEHGIVSTILVMWWIRFQYMFGVRPQVLAAQYYGYQRGNNSKETR